MAASTGNFKSLFLLIFTPSHTFILRPSCSRIRQGFAVIKLENHQILKKCRAAKCGAECVIQKAAASENAVEFCQKSIGGIGCSLATLLFFF